MIQGNPKQLVIDPATVEGFGERMVHSNNLHLNRTYEEGYSAIVEFGGYSGTQLCTRYTRRAPIAGHTECPLKRDWYVRPLAVPARFSCAHVSATPPRLPCERVLIRNRLDATAS